MSGSQLYRRALLTLLAADVAASCGGTPSGPTPPASRLHLKSGVQILTFTGFVLSSDPQFPPCAPVGAPMAGTSVIAVADLQQSGSEWIARSTSSANGTLELHLRDTGTSSALGDLITGPAAGSAIDTGASLRPPNGVTAIFAGASIEGTVQRTAFLTTGRISGTIRFSDGGTSALSTGTCAAVQWMMQPASGLFSLLAMEFRAE